MHHIQKSKYPGLTGGVSKAKYRCKCCRVNPRGCDLQRHYRNNVDWDLYDQLKRAVGERLIQELRTKRDAHTLYVFDGGFNRSRLPSYLNHVTARLDTRKGQGQGDEEHEQVQQEGEASVSGGVEQQEQVEAQTGQRTGEGGSGGQQTISSYFQVKYCLRKSFYVSCNRNL